ncbi:UvsX-like recombinase [Mycobacterium phage Quink]|uniref:RecA-like DNA recombinase n=17 Tax=Viruses TaxID=10239 RepID=Q857P7_9CAUD|nr:UvsX-like recombinase [Mycobacterium phage Cjw1]YP_002014433.1 UvsX-like recombinase [Mycobacterium phage Porky]YP_008051591.1 UvsX-like recombinase [Mycobacterium phage Murphy]YP_008051738.1 UvsX-like recombinase [Mycobacterium phage Dumbo]YP_008052045.1 UvsX-like recombinase [Mycobacterium phage Phrux]YP_008052289.1 UvsX-like recombinase [Mycobacterium phage Phaux]YP_008410128.1 UvsX-like recombinase [Mycobacterium phage Contagion]YP_008430629.1 UvsX-like recombinase [Mycobacterium phag
MSLKEALAEVDKRFGAGSAMKLGDKPQTVDVIPTGSIALDGALGIGGYPRGRVVEIYGPESSGKSTLCLHAVANAQKAGGNAAYIDAEHSLDPEYAKALGVDLDNLVVVQPDTGEQALEIVDLLVKSGELSIVVVDSVAALVPRAELEGDIGDSHVGLHARLMSQAMRKLTGTISSTNTLTLWVNQLREKIGNVGYGPNETTTGGKALRFYASVRMDVRRIATEKEGDEAVGNRTRVKVVKNKLAPPHRNAEFSVVYGEGISREVELLDLAVSQGLVKKSGAWFKYGDKNVAQGKPKAVQWLKANPDITDSIEQAIRGAR